MIAAYGQTSTGKTHTIRGGQNQPGIIQLAADEIFKRIDYLLSEEGIWSHEVGNKDNEASKDHDPSTIKRKIIISVQYMEIYNESVNDLL